MREIEIKARLVDKKAVMDKLVVLGAKLSEPVMQHDQVFGIPGVAGASSNREPWLRIRTETLAKTATIYFTLKKSVTNQLDSIEHEVTANDETELAHIIRHLGFVPYSDLTKTRQHGKLGRIEICIDHIDALGDFIEGEILTTEDSDYQEVVDELWDAFRALGISKTDQITDGYDVLLNKKLGKE